MQKWLFGALAPVLLATAAGAPAQAAVMRAGDTVVVPAGETIHDDLYVAGGNVRVEGRVTGDVLAAGGTVELLGRVDGDVNAAAGTLRLAGSVGQAARLTGGDVTVSGRVGGDMLVAGGQIGTTSGAAVAGQAFVGGGAATLDGRFARGLEARADRLTLRGDVVGPARLEAPELSVMSGASVAGPLALATATAAPIAEGATVTGAVTTRRLEAQRDGGAGGRVLGFLMALLVGLMLLWLVPGLAARSGRVATHDAGRSLLVGLLALVAAPIAAVIVMVTIVGIPVGVFLLVAYAFALYLSHVVVGWVAGEALFARFVGLERPWKRAAALAVGLLGVYLVTAIPVIGPLLTLGVIVWGLGVLALLAYRKWRPGASAPAAT